MLTVFIHQTLGQISESAKVELGKATAQRSTSNRQKDDVQCRNCVSTILADKETSTIHTNLSDPLANAVSPTERPLQEKGSECPFRAYRRFFLTIISLIQQLLLSGSHGPIKLIGPVHQ